MLCTFDGTKIYQLLDLLRSVLENFITSLLPSGVVNLIIAGNSLRYRLFAVLMRAV